MLVDHNHPAYCKKRSMAGNNKWNGAYYYSMEIVSNIIPLIKTDRNWITINAPGHGYDHSIVFIHNNLNPDLYSWLSKYEDLILVCGIPETCSKVAHLGKPIYLPLSVDVAYVEQFRCEKIYDTAFIGRWPKRKGITFPDGTRIIENIPRVEILKLMARCRKVYAVGRTAIEAKILGCEVLPYDPRFPNPSRWKILDNVDAARLLQMQVDEIDRRYQDEESITGDNCQDNLSCIGSDQPDTDRNWPQYHSY